MTDIYDAAHAAMQAQATLYTHCVNVPVMPAEDNVFLAWATERDALSGARDAAVRTLLAHPGYREWHRLIWRDDVTAEMPAVAIWQPVSRLICMRGRPAPRVGDAATA